MENELKNRREFFKEAAKKTLPILGMAVLAVSAPTMMQSCKKLVVIVQVLVLKLALELVQVRALGNVQVVKAVVKVHVQGLVLVVQVLVKKL